MNAGILVLIAVICACLVVYAVCHWQKWFGASNDGDNDDETNFG